MRDDGEFTVPPELACHLPREGASLILRRADTRLVDAEDGRSIVVTAATRSSVQVMLR